MFAKQCAGKLWGLCLGLGISAAVSMASHAQTGGAINRVGDTYFVTGTAAINGNTGNTDVLVGINSAGGAVSNAQLSIGTGGDNKGAGTTLYGGKYYNGINVFGGATSNNSVVVNGGSAYSISAYGSTAVSTTNGANVSYVYAHGNSTVTNTGGSISSLTTYDTASATVQSSAGGVFVNNNSTARIAGNIFTKTAGTVYLHDSGSLTVDSGSVGTIYGLSSGDQRINGGTIDTIFSGYSSSIFINGGNIKNVIAASNNTVSITGGTINTLELESVNSTTVTGASVSRLIAGNADVLVRGGTFGVIYNLLSHDVTVTGRNFSVQSKNPGIFNASNTVYYYGTNYTITGLLQDNTTSATYTFFDAAGRTDTTTGISVSEPGVFRLNDLASGQTTILSSVASEPDTLALLCVITAPGWLLITKGKGHRAGQPLPDPCRYSLVRP